MTKQQRQQVDMFPDSPEANRIRAAEALTLRIRIEDILTRAAVSKRPCRACGTTLFFVPSVTPKGKATLVPYEADGANHFTTCPNAEEFKKR